MSRAVRGGPAGALLLAAALACSGGAPGGLQDGGGSDGGLPDGGGPDGGATEEAVATQWGLVAPPAWPALVCATLLAQLTPGGGSIDGLDADPTRSQPDAARLQAAIDACPAGQAVKLVADAESTAFLTGTLWLRSGVTLWIDRGVTLFASRNPRDYDNGAGTCGTATASSAKACNALIEAVSTTGSALVGEGAISGRGGSVLTAGPNAGLRSWWDVAWQNKSEGLNQQNPFLVRVTGGAGFLLHRLTLLDAPKFHVVTTGVTGVTAWGVKLLTPSLAYTRPGYACPQGTGPDALTPPATCFTPETVKNTDGIDPGQSSNVLIAWSWISVGDDHVALKAHGSPATRNVTVAHNHFFHGHGMSIGSETDSGVSDVAVFDLSVDGRNGPGGIGLRIKTDSSRGGKVSGVEYRQICLRDVRQPLVFDPFYSASTGTRFPDLGGIAIRGLRSLGSAVYGGGTVTFAGYALQGQDLPLRIALDNVVFDGPQPAFAAGHNGGPPALPAATRFTLGPGPVSFASALVPSAASGVTVEGTPGSAAPLDCSAAFVPLRTVLPDAPF